MGRRRSGLCIGAGQEVGRCPQASGTLIGFVRIVGNTIVGNTIVADTIVADTLT